MGVNVIESPWGVRWTSLATLAVILVVVAAVRRRPLLGLTAAMGWLVAFEIPYEATDILVHHRPGEHLAGWLSWLLTVAGWPFAAHALGARPHTRWVALSAGIFGVWIASGFHHNDPGQAGPVMWAAEALNVGSKSALGVAYLLGALAPGRAGWREVLELGHRALGVLPQQRDRGGEVGG